MAQRGHRPDGRADLGRPRPAARDPRPHQQARQRTDPRPHHRPSRPRSRRSLVQPVRDPRQLPRQHRLAADRRAPAPPASSQHPRTRPLTGWCSGGTRGGLPGVTGTYVWESALSVEALLGRSSGESPLFLGGSLPTRRRPARETVPLRRNKPGQRHPQGRRPGTGSPHPRLRGARARSRCSGEECALPPRRERSE